MLYNVLSRVLGKFKLMGMRRCVADLHLCFPNGKLVYVEFKTATGTQKEESIILNEMKEKNILVIDNWYKLSHYKEISNERD